MTEQRRCKRTSPIRPPAERVNRPAVLLPVSRDLLLSCDGVSWFDRGCSCAGAWTGSFVIIDFCDG
ncbi:hypothetical protein KSP39_PZI012375 [Platanthera zijinensis]|uniref:Uncharacterized protein n=1 Tax=Platanthera zijinensis TaxID=2320716 RepID=A0AAP0BF99_9ASPA